MRRSLSAGLVALALLSSSAQAAQHPEKPDFEAAVEAFGEGRLELARRKFEQARADGVASQSLFYNLGVVYFRLEQYDDAEQMFRLLLNSSNEALAQYNLGLVALQRNDVGAARNWFRAAATETSSRKVQALARQRLDSLGSEGLAEASPRRSSAYMSVSGGHNDNIAGIPDASSSNRSGGFADMVMAGRYHFGGESGMGLRLNGLVYTRQYPGDSEFDNTFASLGASWLSQAGAGVLTTTIATGHSWFGSETLEREAQLRIVYRMDSCPMTSSFGGIECEFEGLARGIRGGSGFSAYDGALYRAGFEGTKRTGPWTFSGRFSLEVDNREDLSTADEFYSLSPVRQRFVAHTRYSWTQRIGLGFRADYRLSRYQGDHRLISGGVETLERREDQRLKGAVMMDYEVSRHWHVVTEFSLLDNHSTIERYDFSQREIMVGVEGSF